jgi:pSer/pThr/pTyr-binding forkhead associated (FHA) protein
MARLVLNCEGVGLVTHELVRDIVIIGRAQSNHIVIDHSTVSAHHAAFLKVRDAYWLIDLHSTNGTRINGNFVTNAKVKDGDTMQFGSVAAVFSGHGKRPSTRLIRKLFKHFPT